MQLARNPTPSDLFSSARSAILAQHEELRRRLRGAAAAVEAAATDGLEAMQALRMLAVTLLGQLKSHMAFEESVLLSLFAASAGPAPSLGKTLADEHRRQRAELTRLMGLSATEETSALLRDLRTLIRDVLADMAEEEHMLRELEIAAPA